MTFLFIIALIALAVSLWLNAKAHSRLEDLERWNAHFGHRTDEAFNKANHAVQESAKAERYYDKQADRILTEFTSIKGLVSSLQSRVDKNAALCEEDQKNLMLLADKVESLARVSAEINPKLQEAIEITRKNNAELMAYLKPKPQTRSRSRRKV